MSERLEDYGEKVLRGFTDAIARERELMNRVDRLETRVGRVEEHVHIDG